MIGVPYELSRSIFPHWATCRCCGLELPLELFPPAPGGKSGDCQATCSACMRDCVPGECRLGILH